jgi:hypothetical protein
MGREIPNVVYILPEIGGCLILSLSMWFALFFSFAYGEVRYRSGFCFRQQDKFGKKVFMNITQSDKIGPPAQKTGLVDDEEHEGVSIPLSASKSRHSYDGSAFKFGSLTAWTML